MVARATPPPKRSNRRRWLKLLTVAALGGLLGCGSEATAPAPPATDRVRPVVEARSAKQPLPAELRRFFTAEDFAPLVEPRPGDWLAEFKEPGQTFVSYLAARPNLPDAVRGVLYIQPIGSLGLHAPSLDLLARFTGIYFGLPVKVLPAATVAEVGATTRINPHTEAPQMLAPEVLTWLKPQIPDDAFAVIALTEVDLYPEEDWNFVFGLGSFKERVGVYSLARYHPRFYGKEVGGAEARRLILRRTLKVMAHEIGHMFGIRHCTHFDCVMNGSNSINEADRRSMNLCPVDLRKIHYATGFDIRARYAALHELYDSLDLAGEASWTWARAGKP
jgi:archaemetzincin